MSNISICDRCSAELVEDEDNINDGPEDSDYEGCVLCDSCLHAVEEGDDDA